MTDHADSLIGSWTVEHRRLRERLTGSDAWDEFDGTSSTRRILDGTGVVEANWIGMPDGAHRASAIRTFDPATQTWAIWWTDGRTPHHLDPPVIGGFTDGMGLFAPTTCWTATRSSCGSSGRA